MRTGLCYLYFSADRRALGDSSDGLQRYGQSESSVNNASLFLQRQQDRAQRPHTGTRSLEEGKHVGIAQSATQLHQNLMDCSCSAAKTDGTGPTAPASPRASIISCNKMHEVGQPTGHQIRSGGTLVLGSGDLPHSSSTHQSLQK